MLILYKTLPSLLLKNKKLSPKNFIEKDNPKHNHIMYVYLEQEKHNYKAIEDFYSNWRKEYLIRKKQSQNIINSALKLNIITLTMKIIIATEQTDVIFSILLFLIYIFSLHVLVEDIGRYFSKSQQKYEIITILFFWQKHKTSWKINFNEFCPLKKQLEYQLIQIKETGSINNYLKVNNIKSIQEYVLSLKEIFNLRQKIYYIIINISLYTLLIFINIAWIKKITQPIHNLDLIW